MGNYNIHILNLSQYTVNIDVYNEDGYRENSDNGVTFVSKFTYEKSAGYKQLVITCKDSSGAALQHVRFWTHPDHSWIITDEYVRRQKYGKPLHVVDWYSSESECRDVYNKKDFWKYCNEIKRYSWQPGQADTRDLHGDASTRSGCASAVHTGELSKPGNKLEQAISYMIWSRKIRIVLCAIDYTSQISGKTIYTLLDILGDVTRCLRGNRNVIDSPSSLRLDFQGRDQGQNASTAPSIWNRFSIQYRNATYATVHVPQDLFVSNDDVRRAFQISVRNTEDIWISSEESSIDTRRFEEIRNERVEYKKRKVFYWRDKQNNNKKENKKWNDEENLDL